MSASANRLWLASENGWCGRGNMYVDVQYRYDRVWRPHRTNSSLSAYIFSSRTHRYECHRLLVGRFARAAGGSRQLRAKQNAQRPSAPHFSLSKRRKTGLLRGGADVMKRARIIFCCCVSILSTGLIVCFFFCVISLHTHFSFSLEFSFLPSNELIQRHQPHLLFLCYARKKGGGGGG